MMETEINSMELL